MGQNDDANNSAFYYSVNLLKALLAMNLISDEEYQRIAQISAEHYGVQLYCV